MIERPCLVTMRQHPEQEHGTGGTARLGYTAADPWAVVLVVNGRNSGNPWVFCRGLLEDGMAGRVGEGDVAVSPGPGPDDLVIELCSPSGYVHLTLLAPSVAAFLAATYDEVPAGSETFDVDDELAALLDWTS